VPPGEAGRRPHETALLSLSIVVRLPFVAVLPADTRSDRRKPGRDPGPAVCARRGWAAAARRP